MLKQRLLTAAILIPLCVWGIASLSTNTIAIVLALIVSLGAWEWAGLMGLVSKIKRMTYVFSIVAVMLIIASFVTIPMARYALLALAVCWWVVALTVIQSYSQALDAEHDKRDVASSSLPPLVSGLMGGLVLVPPWAALVILHDNEPLGIFWVLFLMVMIWGADSGAYFAGRRWGKTKVAPTVSPGKTWEGVIGGLVVVICLALLAGLYINFTAFNQVALILLCLLTALFSIIGDLLESVLKRKAGVKDSGNLLPGHGGVLDRIDSLTAAAPVFVLGLLMQRII